MRVLPGPSGTGKQWERSFSEPFSHDKVTMTSRDTALDGLVKDAKAELIHAEENSKGDYTFIYRASTYIWWVDNAPDEIEDRCVLELVEYMETFCKTDCKTLGLPSTGLEASPQTRPSLKKWQLA